MVDALIWKCPQCGLEIKSFYENQLNQNKNAHLAKHLKKQNTEKETKQTEAKR